MDALILAAGKGTRMGGIDRPKCLLDLGGISIIKYQIKCLKQQGINRIFIVTGYNSLQIKSHLNENVIFIDNHKYDSTNNIYSIWNARNIIDDDFICIYGDLFFHEKILENCLKTPDSICLVVERNTRDETMKVRICDDHIIEINKSIPKHIANGNFIGMAKFTKPLIPLLFNEISNLISENHSDLYYTAAIENLIKNGRKINFIETNGLPWMDIDEKSELESANKIYQNIMRNES